MYFLLVTILLSTNFLQTAFADTAKIHYQAVSVQPSNPLPLATLTYNASSLSPQLSTVTSFTPPSLSTFPSPSTLIRIGILNPSTNTLRAPTTVTALDTFAPELFSHFRIWLNDKSGEIWSVSFIAAENDFRNAGQGPIGMEGKAQGKTRRTPTFEIVKKSEAPRPVLNKPIVLSPEGKVKEEEVEKTFLQKYWWMLLGIAVLALAGGGDAK